MKRTPLTRKTPLKSTGQPKRSMKEMKRTPIRRRPLAEQSQRKQDDRAWFEGSKKAVRERSGGRCEFEYQHAAGDGRHLRCLEDGTQFHHINRQSQGHDHRPEVLLHACAWHHSWIHDHVAEARELGYLSPAKRGDL
jgi:hypothetical protein